MTAAVGSHWWSVRGFIAAVDENPLAIAANAAQPGPVPPPSAPVPTAPAPTPKAITPQPAATPKIPDSQQEFFASLLAEMKNIKRENSSLRNQVAETNRDLINLQFRVDTHSSQFRPLRVEEEIDEPEILTDPPILDDSPGVLPPHPDIAGLPPLPGQE
jgi:hypothetical protein